MNSRIGAEKSILKSEIDVSNLLIRHKLANEGKLIEEVELRPGEQARVFLGQFESRDVPKSFSVALGLSATEDEEVIRQITRLEFQDKRYELILHIANYSGRVVNAEVWKSL